ncbi:hypothetical protein MCOR27_001395 [Pyricularia oryzae]|nr:hypothetical protein MCOR01_010303 [Pyricularia oryzae]KAI6255679.1 hypothetical protein MCOR19_007828 [Pyricularia oryzae]KAI6287494.1 hypothetical protein MCOR27_001395 [Pyricularia oryzae]KAI6360906.1 hypothetical protein MCOR32_008857 [Pyricularia oryzae]KAI6452895.1 hypothetical protein MCOR22_000679 [Pyricularia oryzae]
MHVKQSTLAIAAMLLLPAVNAIPAGGHAPSGSATVVTGDANGCMVTVHQPKRKLSDKQKSKGAEEWGKLAGLKCILFGHSEEIADYYVTVPKDHCDDIRADFPSGWYAVGTLARFPGSGPWAYPANGSANVLNLTRFPALYHFVCYPLASELRIHNMQVGQLAFVAIGLSLLHAVIAATDLTETDTIAGADTRLVPGCSVKLYRPPKYIGCFDRPILVGTKCIPVQTTWKIKGYDISVWNGCSTVKGINLPKGWFVKGESAQCKVRHRKQ